MEISKPYKGKGKRKIKKMPFTVRGYILYYVFLGCYNLNLFSLLLINMPIPIVNHPENYVAKINVDKK